MAVTSTPAAKANDSVGASDHDRASIEALLAKLVTPAAAERWLNTPNATLAGLTPSEAIDGGEAGRVNELLMSLAEGIYV